jgi:hypothetical protein
MLVVIDKTFNSTLEKTNEAFFKYFHIKQKVGLFCGCRVKQIDWTRAYRMGANSDGHFIL